MKKLARLLFYEKPLRYKVKCYSSEPDIVSLSDLGNEPKVVRKPWKLIGRIAFEDIRTIEEIARDFADRLGTKETGIVNSGGRYHVEIPQSQRPIIKQSFVEYFIKK